MLKCVGGRGIRSAAEEISRRLAEEYHPSRSCVDVKIGAHWFASDLGRSVLSYRQQLVGIYNLKIAEATVVYRAECRTQNPVCITGGGGSSPYHGGVLTQHLDIYSVKIAVHSDRAVQNVPRNMHGLSFGEEKYPHRLLCQVMWCSPHANKRVHACNHERLSRPIFPWDQVPPSYRRQTLNRRSRV